MNTNRLLMSWIPMSMLLASAHHLAAQCTPPGAIWLHTQQSSTALTLNWVAVANATQYQVRYWETASPEDKTIVDNFAPAPSILNGLKKSSHYTLDIRSKCGGSFSTWGTSVTYFTNYDTSSCSMPTGVLVSAGASGMDISWTSSGSHTIRYRLGNTGDWLIPTGALSVSVSPFSITGLPSGDYQIEVKRNCSATASDFINATFTTQETGLCLADKNFGKNLSGEAMALIDQNFNKPSPFTLFSMIGVNDGGLLFRAFQNASSNQITRLTTQYRNFHTIDDDFDNTLVNYTQNTKPKNTSPEGTPAFTEKNKGFYSIYRKKHGFTNITAAIELLQYAPQSWKEKIYKESDWSSAGPVGITKSFENYTRKFIDVFAPANGVDSQILVMNFQVGNELWDYPVKSDYHSMLKGARIAFINKYGEKSAGGWKMQLVVGAFQAFRDNNCPGVLRDFSNCGGSLDRHDFIGDYLAIEDCNILKDIDAIDCHSYSFLPHSTSWTYPENPESETGQIKNLAGWLDVNTNSATGVLSNTRLWATEFGFDSNPTTGVGEKTQSAYLLRGLLLHSRYHYEKVFFYNAFDHTRTDDVNYTGLYNSSGLWNLGTHPANSAWPSPLAEHGAKAKPAWFGLMDLKFRFGGHVFYKALVEDTDAYVFLLATADGTDPFLVFWSPQQTTDANLNVDIPISKVVNWSDAIGGNFKVETPMAQAFALDAVPGPTFMAVTNVNCGTATLKTIRRNPSFLHLVPCIDCPNITDPGSNTAPNPGSGDSPFNAGIITSDVAANGGTGGSVVYQWQESSDNINFTDIAGNMSLTYDPPGIMHTTYYRRGAKRTSCPDYLYALSVVITVLESSICPAVLSFQRQAYTNAGCNGAGDYYFEVALGNVTVDEQITLAGLPANGVNITLSSLNGIAFNITTFLDNLHYISSSSFRWPVHAANGVAQTLRIYYCWVNNYPDPVALTTATSLCSGITTACIVAANIDEPDMEERSVPLPPPLNLFGFTAEPNPGTDQILMTYFGKLASQSSLSIFSVGGQLMSTRHFSEMRNLQQWQIETDKLPSGVYFLRLQTNREVKFKMWEKL